MSLSSVQRWIQLMLSIGAPGENPDPILPGGARILFAGHSFFVPVARTFNRIAELDPTRYPDHASLDPVFSPGQSGSPLSLWNDSRDRNKILAALESDPPPEVLSLTKHTDTVQEHYQLWLDEAKSRVEDIALLIVFPFLSKGAVTPLAEYDEQTQEALARNREIVRGLREDNPNNAIYVIEQATTSVSMKSMFEDGLLDDDVPGGLLCRRGGGCLFRDANPGHPGEMMYDMATLLWLHRLYGMDPMTYFPSSGDWYSDDAVRNITTVTINSNERFDANNSIPSPTNNPAPAPTEQPTPAPTTQPTQEPTNDPTPAPTPPVSRVFIACGNKNHRRCATPALDADVDEEHEVRCCSDRNLGRGWRRKPHCNVWSESEIGAERSCFRERTFAFARDACEGVGARLCTLDEMTSNCSKGTGCWFDEEMVWTSTPYTGPGEGAAPLPWD